MPLKKGSHAYDLLSIKYKNIEKKAYGHIASALTIGLISDTLLAVFQWYDLLKNMDLGLS